MANIEKLDYGEFLRPSTAHAIGKINEIIDNLDSSGGGGTEFATIIINAESNDYPIADKTYAELVEIAETGKPVLAFVDDAYAQWYECFTDTVTNPDNEQEYNVVILRRFKSSFVPEYPPTDGAIQAQMFYFTEDEFHSWYRSQVYDIPALEDILPTVTVSYDTENDPIIATVDNFPDPQIGPKYQAVLIKDTYINDVTLGNVIWDDFDPDNEPVQIVWGFSGIVDGSIAYNTMTLTLEAYTLNEGELVIETDTLSGGGEKELLLLSFRLGANNYTLADNTGSTNAKVCQSVSIIQSPNNTLVSSTTPDAVWHFIENIKNKYPAYSSEGTALSENSMRRLAFYEHVKIEMPTASGTLPLSIGRVTFSYSESTGNRLLSIYTVGPVKYSDTTATEGYLIIQANFTNQTWEYFYN